MIHIHDDQTIIAQCTPQGPGALALIRITGIDAIRITDCISVLPQRKKLTDAPTHTIHYGYVIDQHKQHIDQVLFLLMRAPHTFTGQDTVEITCHNNPFIIEQIITESITAGARLADPGEFSKRAVLNNKIDLIQAEAINEVIHAHTQHALKQSLSQLNGSFSSWITTIEQQLVKALAFSEASFEFIDEEDMAFGDKIKQIIHATRQHIVQLATTYDQQKHIREGFRIAIIGSVNAGKSSLFNALLHKKRAIVTNIAGTTRDALEAGIYKNGNYWTLIDTAGLRKTNNIIEKEGITISHQQAQLADIILLVFDGSRIVTPHEQEIYQELFNKYAKKIILIQNKSDLPSQTTLFNNQSAHAISAQANIGIASIESAIQEKIIDIIKEHGAPFLLNKRQFTLLQQLDTKLATLEPMLDADIQYELISYHLTDALAQLSELTGKTISEQGMDAVFREFCVGK